MHQQLDTITNQMADTSAGGNPPLLTAMQLALSTIQLSVVSGKVKVPHVGRQALGRDHSMDGLTFPLWQTSCCPAFAAICNLLPLLTWLFLQLLNLATEFKILVCGQV